MALTDSRAPGTPPLTPEHQMLLRIRDTLYEGSWDDFATDLQARIEGGPFVFELVPSSPEMTATVKTHLRLIAEMQAWEAAHARVLRPEEEAA